MAVERTERSERMRAISSARFSDGEEAARRVAREWRPGNRRADASPSAGADGARSARSAPRHSPYRIRKFKRGFFRRPQQAIGQDRERVVQDQEREARRSAARQRRAKRLMKNTHRNGNILVPDSRGGRARGRRHLPEKSELLKREEYIRSTTGSQRYYLPPSEARREQWRKQREAREKRLDRKSAVLGYGRGQIKSHGVLDNFLGPADPSAGAKGGAAPRRTRF